VSSRVAAQVCWCEIDSHQLAMYVFSDDVPVLTAPFDQVQAVSPVHLQPLGSVFDIHVSETSWLRRYRGLDKVQLGSD
jgi:hypothetical protein